MIFWVIVSTFIEIFATERCHVNFKVYVYPIRQELLLNSEAARSNKTFHVCKKCIYEQFSLEYVIFDYFTSFCGRTYDPTEADYYYLPIIRDVDYRIALGAGKRSPSVIENALLEAIENKNYTYWDTVFGVTHEYWEKSNGSNHIIVMPAPVTNLRHQSNMRGFFHYMMQLHAPIFFNVEYSRSFIEEYPICSKMKNLIVPYPTTDPDLITHRLYVQQYPNHTRDSLIFYQGGHHGSCEFIRSALSDIIKNKQYAIQRGDRKRELGFQTAIFCPIPIGDSPSSKRMYDVMNFGCIPVVLSDDLIWAFSLDAGGGEFNITHFSIHFPQAIVQKTASYLLQYKIKQESDINFGIRLPISHKSWYDILKEVATEENNNNNNNNGDNNGSIKTQQIVARTINNISKDKSSSRRYLVAGTKTTAASTNMNTVGKKKPAPALSSSPPPGAIAHSSINTLIRMLQKVPLEDIRYFQQQVLQHAHYYRYYDYNTTSDALATLQDAVTSYHYTPNGGAITMIEQFLSKRKQRGISSVYQDCEVERSKKHKYIGRYPCEKRRRKRRKLTTSDNNNTLSAFHNNDDNSNDGHQHDYFWDCSGNE